MIGSNDHNEELQDLAMRRADSLEEKLTATESKLENAQAELAKATEATAANAKHEALLVERLKAAASVLAGKYTPPLLLFCSSSRCILLFSSFLSRGFLFSCPRQGGDP